jgi:hypothetical protein
MHECMHLRLYGNLCTDTSGGYCVTSHSFILDWFVCVLRGHTVTKIIRTKVYLIPTYNSVGNNNVR